MAETKAGALPTLPPAPKSFLRIIDVRAREPKPERIIVYGRSGIGKTRFVLSLPDTEKWGEIVYYAADDNTEDLGPIDPALIDRIHPVKPEGDPTKCFQQFCMTDWVKKWPAVKTLVVDTYSTIAWQSMQQTANDLSIDREPHYKIGEVEEGGVVIPNRGDYQGIDSLSRNYLSTLFIKQRHMNIIFTCHEQWKEVSKGKFAGGPAHPGQKMTEDLPAAFNTVIRLIREPYIPKGAAHPRTRVVAVSDNDGAYLAKLREGNYVDGNPMPREIVERDPVGYWVKFDKVMQELFERANHKKEGTE